ncbi:hypothetical protein J6590_085158, partial [Homalodisca vitripennis]
MVISQSTRVFLIERLGRIAIQALWCDAVRERRISMHCIERTALHPILPWGVWDRASLPFLQGFLIYAREPPFIFKWKRLAHKLAFPSSK